MKDFLESQGLKTGPAVIYQDNTSTLAKVMQDSVSGRGRKKHFKKRRLLVEESVDKKIIKLKYIPAESMVTDLLIKPLQGGLLRRLRAATTNCDDALCGGVSENVDSEDAQVENINNVNNFVKHKKHRSGVTGDF